MSEDSFEEADHFEFRSYETPGTQIEDQLKSKQKKGYLTAAWNLYKVGHLVDMCLNDLVGLYILQSDDRSMRLT
jgi:hypothetical protein